LLVAPVAGKRGLSRAMGLVGVLLAPLIASLNYPGQDASAAENAFPAVNEIAVRKGLLTVNLRDAPMANVLMAVGAQAGFDVIIRGDLSAPVTWSFSDLPLDKGIRRLLDDRPLVMIYAPSQGQAGVRPLLKVIALGARGDAGDGTTPVARTMPARKTEVSRNTAAVSLDDDRENRLRAVQRLAIMPDAAATKDLALLLSQDEDALIRQIAAIALGNIGGAGAQDALTAALQDEESLVRGRATQALAKWGPESVGLLVELLVRDPAANVRRQAALGLGRMRGERAMDALQAAQADPDYAVRQAAFFALSRLANY